MPQLQTPFNDEKERQSENKQEDTFENGGTAEMTHQCARPNYPPHFQTNTSQPMYNSSLGLPSTAGYSLHKAPETIHPQRINIPNEMINPSRDILLVCQFYVLISIAMRNHNEINQNVH